MRTIYILVPCLLFAGCGLLDAGQAQTVNDVITQIEAQGALTAAQAEALRQAVITNTGEPWWMQLGKVVLEVGLAVVGVRVWRGPAATGAERAARIAAGSK